ncbi:MAG: methyltransferase domain-containing protein [Longimicrobiales bacterium]
MKPMTEFQDAFGRALLDHIEGRGGDEIIERDDGYIALSAPAAKYFEAPAGTDRDALDRAVGRVLDIGAGAGRAALYLADGGHEVVAIDISPLAVQVMRSRGVEDARVLGIRDIDRRELGRFDTIVMLGNNFGLLGTHGRARRLLRRFARMTNDNAVIIAETRDPYDTIDPFHLAYHEQNRQRGRMAGQLRLRARHQVLKTPWFDYLFVSRPELAEILVGTGWRVAETIDTDGPQFTVILEKHR